MKSLPGFTVKRVFPVPGAVLLQLHSAGGVLLVLDRGVIAPLALGAGEQNVDAHDLLHDFRHHAGADGTAAFANGEAQTLLHGDGGDEFNIEGGVVAGHDHFHAFVQGDDARHVRGAEIELGTVPAEEGRMAAAFFLREHVHFRLELLVRRDGLGRGENLAAFHFVTLGAAQQRADVVAGLALVKQLAEHFHTGAGGLGRGVNAHDFHFVANLDDAAFHTPGHHGAAAGNGEHVFDRHEEGLVRIAHRFREVTVAGGEKIQNRLGVGRIGAVGFQSLQGGTANNRDIVAGVAVGGEQFAHFKLDEFEQFGVVHHVALVHEHNEVRHADLTGEQDVFAGLRHGAVGGGHHDDRAVHLGRAGDHVLDVVGVAGAVDVRVVAVFGFVFDMGRGDGDAAFLFFGGLVDFVVADELAALLQGSHLGDGGRQRGLAVVNVPDGADIEVRLRPGEFLFAHDNLPSDLVALYVTKTASAKVSDENVHHFSSFAPRLECARQPGTSGTAKRRNRGNGAGNETRTRNPQLGRLML